MTRPTHPLFRETSLEAKRLQLKELLARDPKNAELLLRLGVLSFEEGDLQEAQSWMEKACKAAPRSDQAAFSLALILKERGQTEALLEALRRTLQLNPSFMLAHYHYGLALREKGEWEAALKHFDKALSLDPKNAGLFLEKGNTLKALDRLDEAQTAYELALFHKPGDAHILNNLGIIFFLRHDYERAEKAYNEALAADPSFPKLLNNMGILRRLEGKLEEAERYFKKELAIDPHSVSALNNLGNTYKDGQKHEEAISCFKKALEIEPKDAETHCNLGMAYLSLGQYEEGWAELEWRWQTKPFAKAKLNLSEPSWQGEKGEGQTILITAEQGFGDTIQFCRFVPLVKEKGFRVILGIEPELQRLIGSLEGADEILTKGDPLPTFDKHAYMMSLPHALGITAQTVPARIPYLKAPEEDVVFWEKRIDALEKTGLKIGLAWAGGIHSRDPAVLAIDEKRSIDPALLSPLFQEPQTLFFSLQKHRGSFPETFPLLDWTKECADFAATAGLIENLDLVITVDTALAHLAGALGKPVWLLNRFNSCWRWIKGREDTSWYPKMRIFQQKEMFTWPEVIERVANALHAETKSL